MNPRMTKADAIRKIDNIVKVHRYLNKMPLTKDAKAAILSAFIRGTARQPERSRAWGNPELMRRS